MNVVGLIIPKLALLVAVLLAPIQTGNKCVLILLWLVKLIIAYDLAKPGNGGKLYHLAKGKRIEVQELVVNCVRFVPTVLFLVCAVLFKAWIPLALVAVSAVISIISIVGSLKDMR